MVGYLGGHVIRGILSMDLHYGFIQDISELSGPLSAPWSLFCVPTDVIALYDPPISVSVQAFHLVYVCILSLSITMGVYRPSQWS